MDQDELLRRTAHVFAQLDIDYFVTGSMVTIAFGISRFTNGIDIVADIANNQVDALCNEFEAPEFYCSKQAVREAIILRREFNIIHPSSGLKVDVFIPAMTDFNCMRMKRRKRIQPNTEFEVWFSSPEDAIIKKLDFYREGQSEKHLSDIANVLKVQGPNIDQSYIESWVTKLELMKEWQLVKDHFGS